MAANSALIMKSGVYDGEADTHKLMDQIFTREDTIHAWYDEAGEVHPFDRTTKPTRARTRSTSTANIPGRRPFVT